MTTEVFNIRYDVKKLAKVNKIAKMMDRSRNYIVNQAIDQMIEIHDWQIDQIKSGLNEVKSGRIATGKEIDRVFEKFS